MRKIVSVGAILCLITACGVTNSKKFNPQRINGLWLYENTVSYQELGGYNLYHHFLYITYPYIQTCTRVQILRGRTDNMNIRFRGLTKMDVTVAHLKKDRYKVKRINGAAVTGNITYIISADSVLKGLRYLTITKLKNGIKKATKSYLFLFQRFYGCYFSEVYRERKRHNQYLFYTEGLYSILS